MKQTNVGKLFAFPDSKCVWGYQELCEECITVGSGVPHWVDLTKPIEHPPAENKLRRCEVCGRRGRLCGGSKEVSQ